MSLEEEFKKITINEKMPYSSQITVPEYLTEDRESYSTLEETLDSANKRYIPYNFQQTSEQRPTYL